MTPAAVLLLACVAGPAPFDAAAVRAESQALTLAGKWERALSLLDAAEGRAKDAGPAARAQLSVERGRVLMDSSFFHRRDPAAARAALEEAQQLAKAAKDKGAALDAALYLGQLSYSAAFDTKDWKAPRAVFERVLAEREKSKDKHGLSETLFYLGLTYEQDGQPKPAYERYARALAVAEETGDVVQQSYARRHMGGIEEERGELEAAAKNIELEIALRRQGGFLVGVPFALVQKADFRAARGASHDEVRTILEEAVAAAKASDSTRALYAANAELSRREAASGDPRKAFACAEEALKAARGYGGASEIREAEALIGSAGRALPN